MSNTQYDNLCGERSASADREIIRIMTNQPASEEAD